MTLRIVTPVLSATRPHFTSLPPLALYVHIPWCLSKCPYCDFNSHEMRDPAGPPEALYVETLLHDLELALPSIWGRRFVSVFIGGGTPSLFSPEAIDALLAGIRARVPLMPEAEVTLEANPGTFERVRFAGFRDAGVNRLSVGVQSFEPSHLAALGRVHDRDEALAAAEAAIELFPEVNLDLMYALPRQRVEDALRDAHAAIGLRPTHLSFYHLTIEPNTLFHRHPPPLPDDDTAIEIEHAVHAALADAGYAHYETSAHALPGHACRHNLNYWEFGDYLGIGAGAHSKLSFPDRVVREVRWKQPRRYMEEAARGTPLQDQHEVGRDDIGFEFMLNALRLTAGVPTAFFTERTGFPITIVQREMNEAVSRGLLAADPARIVATPLGQRFLNDLQAIFLRDHAPTPPAPPVASVPIAFRENP